MEPSRTPLLAEADLLGVIAEAAPVGIGAVSADGRIVSANEEIARILGCDSVADLMAQPLESFHEHPALALEVVTTECTIGEDLPPVLANGGRPGRPLLLLLLLLLVLDRVVSASLEAGVRTVSVEVSGTPDEVTIRVCG